MMASLPGMVLSHATDYQRCPVGNLSLPPLLALKPRPSIRGSACCALCLRIGSTCSGARGSSAGTVLRPSPQACGPLCVPVCLDIGRPSTRASSGHLTASDPSCGRSIRSPSRLLILVSSGCPRGTLPYEASSLRKVQYLARSHRLTARQGRSSSGDGIADHEVGIFRAPPDVSSNEGAHRHDVEPPLPDVIERRAYE
jgi:hypothetical protein